MLPSRRVAGFKAVGEDHTSQRRNLDARHYFSEARAVNAAGQVAGYSFEPDFIGEGITPEAFLLDAGGTRDIVHRYVKPVTVHAAALAAGTRGGFVRDDQAGD